MNWNTKSTRRATLVGLLCSLCIGCGGVSYDTSSPTELGLSELAAIYRGFTKNNNRPPKDARELKSLASAFPAAMERIRSGELIVHWGAPLATEGDAVQAVLAYTKGASEQGGSVLLQDAQTIKKVTALEFKAATQAEGTHAAVPEKRKK